MLRARTHVLALRETFQIARGAADEETVVAVELERDGIVARGEGAPVDYWGETAEAIARRARGRRRGAARRRPVRGRGDPARAWRALGRAAGREDGARRRASTTGSAGASGSRCWRLLGTDARHAADLVHDRDRHGRGHRGPHAPRAPATRCSRSRSAGRATSSGCGRCARRPSARLRIDGNEGWDLDTARELTPELIELGVEFVEQPFPAGDLDALPRLPRALAAPAGADRRGLPRPRARSRGIAAYADGIVIKLVQVRRHPRGAADDPRGARAATCRSCSAA